MGPYLVDSNFFIQAHRVFYPLDVVESFWHVIQDLAMSDVIISIDKVRDEIYSNKDSLSQWCENNLPTSFFRKTSIDSVLRKYADVANWAKSRRGHYLNGAINEFLEVDEADAWLVAYAMSKNKIVVTYETSEPKRKNKIKIPDACKPLAVEYINTIEMFRQLEITF